MVEAPDWAAEEFLRVEEEVVIFVECLEKRMDLDGDFVNDHFETGKESSAVTKKRR